MNHRKFIWAFCGALMASLAMGGCEMSCNCDGSDAQDVVDEVGDEVEDVIDKAKD